METSTFAYSKIVGISGLVFTICGMAAFLAIGFNANDDNLCIFICAIEAALAAFTIYFIIRCFVPAIKNKTALTLDDEKLTFHATDRVIYWKDVVEISLDSSRYTKFLSFDLLGSDSKNISLGLTWVAGDNHDIYETVQAYFEQSLMEDGQLGYTDDEDI